MDYFKQLARDGWTISIEPVQMGYDWDVDYELEHINPDCNILFPDQEHNGDLSVAPIQYQTSVRKPNGRYIDHLNKQFNTIEEAYEFLMDELNQDDITEYNNKHRIHKIINMFNSFDLHVESAEYIRNNTIIQVTLLTKKSPTPVTMSFHVDNDISFEKQFFTNMQNGQFGWALDNATATEHDRAVIAVKNGALELARRALNF